MHGARQPHDGGPDALGGQGQHRVGSTAAATDRTVGGVAVLLGGGVARHHRREAGMHERLATAFECGREGLHGARFLVDALFQVAPVVAEGQVDDTVGLRGAGTEAVKVGEVAAERRPPAAATAVAAASERTRPRTS